MLLANSCLFDQHICLGRREIEDDHPQPLPMINIRNSWWVRSEARADDITRDMQFSWNSGGSRQRGLSTYHWAGLGVSAQPPPNSTLTLANSWIMPLQNIWVRVLMFYWPKNLLHYKPILHEAEIQCFPGLPSEDPLSMTQAHTLKTSSVMFVH